MLVAFSVAEGKEIFLFASKEGGSLSYLVQLHAQINIRSLRQEREAQRHVPAEELKIKIYVLLRTKFLYFISLT